MSSLLEMLNRARRAGGGEMPWPSPRLVQPQGPSGRSAREIALEAEVAALRRQQAALVRQERESSARTDALRDQLDRLAGEIDQRAQAIGDPSLSQRGRTMIARVRDILMQDGAPRPEYVRGVIESIKIAAGMMRSPYNFSAPFTTPAGRSPTQPVPRTLSSEEVVKLVVDSGNRARVGSPEPLPDDPVARQVILAGYKARNEKPPAA